MSRKGSRMSKRDVGLNQKIPVILSRKRKSETNLEDYENEITIRSTRPRQACQEQNWIPLDDKGNQPIWESSSQSLSTTVNSSVSSIPNFRRFSLPPQFLNLTRTSPLPNFTWADPADVWALLCKKDKLYTRNHDYMMSHPSLQPRMRAILLDWLIEVCEVYRLHRETYYLAMDFIDRFLATQTDLPKQQLQLIGITSLFIAAKIEEIYPPKLNEFAYVTDGACTETEIMLKELIIMKSLNWELSPVTVNSWLGIYLQLANEMEEKALSESKENKNVLEVKQFSSHTFVQAARLLDLCTLDILSLRYSYSVIAAAAVYHTVGESMALKSSGYTWDEISSCIYWMAPYALTLREQGPVEVKTFSQIPIEDTHNIQTHNVDLQLFESAQTRQTETTASPPSPVLPGMLTPPQSKTKPRVSNAPLSPINSNNLLTPSTVSSESPRCSTVDWEEHSPQSSYS